MPIPADQALRELYARRPQLLAYLRVMVRDRHLAEDLFQELAVLVVQKAAEIAEPAALPAWARTAARFTALKVLRTQRRRPQVFGGDVLDVLEAEWSAIEAEQPEERIAALRDCVERLAPQSRRLLASRYDEGLSPEELAARIGKSANAVYVAFSRIHKALAACVRARLAQRGRA